MPRTAKLKEDRFNYLTKEKCKYDEYDPDIISPDQCLKLKPFFGSNTKKAIELSARMQIPLHPVVEHQNEKQIVLGTTKYLLPYYICKDDFLTFTVPDEMWNLKLNMHFLDCALMNMFSESDVIRLVTTDKDLLTHEGGLRITAKEICYLKHKYGLKFFKYVDPIINNVYFLCHKRPDSKCLAISGHEIEYH